MYSSSFFRSRRRFGSRHIRLAASLLLGCLLETAVATATDGARLSIVAPETAAVACTSRAVYGGRGYTATFADAGVKLATGKPR